MHQILFVVGQRFTREEIQAFNLLKQIIFDQDAAKYTTIVRTNFPEFTDEIECEKDRQKLRQENSKLSEIFSSSKIVYVDNPPLIGLPLSVAAARESRELSNERLIMHLGTCQGIYKPTNLIDFQQRIDDYQTKTEQLEKELQEKEQIRQKQEAELQQQISSLQIQQQNELNEVRKNFSNQLDSVYAEQQRQISQENDRHQRELEEVKENYGYVAVITGFQCPQGHQGCRYYPEIDYVKCNICPQRIFTTDECLPIGRKVPLEDYIRISGKRRDEKLRQLQQRIQNQERLNQERASIVYQLISQRQQSIDNQRLAEENRIIQWHEEIKKDLESEITRQIQEQEELRKEYGKLQKSSLRKVLNKECLFLEEVNIDYYSKQEIVKSLVF